MPDLHTLAIIIHTLSATAAFVVGIVIIFLGDARQQLRLGVALMVLLILLEVFLIVAILSHLTSLTTITQIIFWGLAVLGAYMIWRGVQAVSVLREAPANQGAVVDHVGFNLISLFDGFAIITAVDLQAPGWLIAVIAVGAVVLGIYAINLRKKALAG